MIYLKITGKGQKIRSNLCRLPSAVNVMLKLSNVCARRPGRGCTEYKVHRQRLYHLCRSEVNVGEVFTANKKRGERGKAFEVVRRVLFSC